MIVSDRYRYLFLEMPYTASTAMSRELIDHYDGKLVFAKRHAPYSEFQRIATRDQKNYFVFASVRNPLDTVVTTFLKSVRKGLIDSDLDFPTYFDRTFTLPYANFLSLSARHIDFLIRYETLQDDFRSCLGKIGIDQARPLPSRNRTSEKSKHYLDYYTPEIIPRAKRVFGPFMDEWGYEFPDAWGQYSVSKTAKTAYDLTCLAKVGWWTCQWRWKISPTPL